jgi:hypothetical protein
MTLEDRVNKLEQKIEEHDNKIINIEKKQLTDWYELSDLITKAVEKGIEKISKELQEAKCEIDVLKSAEGKRAIEQKGEFWKTVRTVLLGVVITFFATILLNNFIAMASSSTNAKQVEIKEEVQ